MKYRCDKCGHEFHRHKGLCPKCGIGIDMGNIIEESSDSTTKTPDKIKAIFDKHWRYTDSPDELEEALEAFYNDIKSSLTLTLNAHERVVGQNTVNDILDSLDDYVANHYFGN